jgi:hypothetical protein
VQQRFAQLKQLGALDSNSAWSYWPTVLTDLIFLPKEREFWLR